MADYLYIAKLAAAMKQVLRNCFLYTIIAVVCTACSITGCDSADSKVEKYVLALSDGDYEYVEKALGSDPSLAYIKGVPLNSLDRSGREPGIAYDDALQVDFSLYHIKGIDWESHSGSRKLLPLQIAAGKGYADIASILLLHGADVNSGNPSPARLAAVNGHLDVFKLLTEDGADYASVLLYAVSEGQYEIASHLLELGVDVDQIDSASGDSHSSQYLSPLHVAADRGYLDLCQLLIDNKAWLDARTKGWSIKGEPVEWTPLHFAAFSGHGKIVRLLIESGANLNLLNSYGQTPLHLAAIYNHETIASMLLKSGADVLNTSHELTAHVRSGQRGNSPLHDACRHGNAEIAATLLNAGASVNVRGYNGDTPLHNAIMSGNAALVQALLAEWNADIDLINMDQLAPMHVAVKRNDLPVIEILLNYGARIVRHGEHGVHLSPEAARLFDRYPRQ